MLARLGCEWMSVPVGGVAHLTTPGPVWDGALGVLNPAWVSLKHPGVGVGGGDSVDCNKLRVNKAELK